MIRRTRYLSCLVKKFFAFYGAWEFDFLFRKTEHKMLCSQEPEKSTLRLQEPTSRKMWWGREKVQIRVKIKICVPLFCWNPEVKGHIGRPRHRWENNINIDKFHALFFTVSLNRKKVWNLLPGSEFGPRTGSCEHENA